MPTELPGVRIVPWVDRKISSGHIINHWLFADGRVCPLWWRPTASVHKVSMYETWFNLNMIWSIGLLSSLTVPPCHNYTDKYKYLGHIIHPVLADWWWWWCYETDQITICPSKQNYPSFYFVSSSTKLALFKAYCTPIYGCQLWSRLFQYSNRKLQDVQVAYNDAFRQLLLREPRWCSASRLFVYNNVPSFDAVVRKLVYSFRCSLQKW